MARPSAYKKSTRLWAFCAAALLFTILLFSAAVLIACADHDCPGEDCGICARLEAVVAAAARVGGAVAFAAAISALALLSAALLCLPAQAGCGVTLTRQKIRLNI